jgi:hypothetical protein
MHEHNQHINQIKPENLPESPPQKRGFLKKLVDGILDVLGGEFLMHDKARKQFNYVFFIAGIALIYIANNYYAERTSRQIDNLNRELKELHYAYISSKSVLMQESKQSEVARKLKTTGIRESVEPVKRLKAEKNQ